MVGLELAIALLLLTFFLLQFLPWGSAAERAALVPWWLMPVILAIAFIFLSNPSDDKRDSRLWALAVSLLLVLSELIAWTRWHRRQRLLREEQKGKSGD